MGLHISINVYVYIHVKEQLCLHLVNDRYTYFYTHLSIILYIYIYLYNITPRPGVPPRGFGFVSGLSRGLRVLIRFFQGVLRVLCQIWVLGFGFVAYDCAFWKQISSAIWAICRPLNMHKTLTYPVTTDTHPWV